MEVNHAQTHAALITPVEFAVGVIGQHIPSLSDENADTIQELALATLTGEADLADLALRTCACGARIDGFYAYVDHLTAVLNGKTIGGTS